MKDNDLVILVHGFNRNEKDMFALKNHLEKLSYNAVTVNLPTRFKSLEQCTDIFAGKFKEITKNAGPAGKIHFVGHSMGGLIIRSLLSKRTIDNLGRCVLIATPNKGTKLADMANSLFRPLTAILKPLKSLMTNSVKFPEPLNPQQPEIGVIAGDRNNLLLGMFLSKQSDGRVEVESTKLDIMRDFVVRNFNHYEIHHKFEVAKLVHFFLQNGTFIR